MIDSWREYWPLIGREWTRDLDTGLWLAESDHVTWILASDWLRVFTWMLLWVWGSGQVKLNRKVHALAFNWSKLWSSDLEPGLWLVIGQANRSRWFFTAAPRALKVRKSTDRTKFSMKIPKNLIFGALGACERECALMIIWEPGLWLAESIHVTWILAPDWPCVLLW